MLHLVSQDKLEIALASQYGDLSPERKQVLLLHVRNCKPERQAALHQNFSEGLTPDELAFYKAIVVITPDPIPKAVAQDGAPAPTPEAAATKVTEGARAAESHATGRGKSV
jgi:hypothetical protein